MADIDLLGTLAPPAGGTEPITRGEYVMGVARIVPSSAARTAIAATQLRDKDLCLQADTGTWYQWSSGGSSWSTYSGFGGGGGTGNAYPPVDIVLTSTDTLSGLAARDGLAPTSGVTRILYTVTGASAGIYVAAGGAWTRATDMDADAEVVIGNTVFIKTGTLGAGTWWQLKTGSTIAGSKSYTKILGNPDTVIGEQGSVTRLGHDVRSGVRKIESGSNYIDVALVSGAGATVIWSFDAAGLGFSAKALLGFAANVFVRWPSDDKSDWASGATHWRHETVTPIKVEDRAQQTLDGASGANNYVTLTWVLSGTVIQLKANNLRASDCVGFGVINFVAGDTV